MKHHIAIHQPQKKKKKKEKAQIITQAEQPGEQETHKAQRNTKTASEPTIVVPNNK